MYRKTADRRSRTRRWNPPNRFDPVSVEWDEEPPPQDLEILEDDSQGILSHNDSPDLGFDWSVNPYRGCTHACAYCYARSYHEYLGMGAGSDFERRIVVKRRAPELLRDAFLAPRWTGEHVAFCGVTDGWQPLERRFALTRACLEVCVAFRNPVAIVTRSPLIVRDLDLLVALAEHRAVGVTISIPIGDRALQKQIEPGAPAPEARFAAIRALADAGVPVGISVGPVIPGLTDAGIPAVLERARESGATWAWRGFVRLQGSVADVFASRLRDAWPGRAEAVLGRIRRLGQDGRFGRRFSGPTDDPGWAAIAALVQLTVQRLGYGPTWTPPRPTPFRRPQAQMSLFGAG